MRKVLLGMVLVLCCAANTWALQDLLYWDSTNAAWYARTYTSAGAVGGTATLGLRQELVLGDGNNDGLTDTIYRDGGYYAQTYLPSGTQPGPSGTQPNGEVGLLGTAKKISLGDMNNDGEQDIVYYNDGRGEWYAWQRQPAAPIPGPAGTWTSQDLRIGLGGRDQVKLGDINNDGWMDTMYLETNNLWYARTYHSDGNPYGSDYLIPAVTINRPFVIGDYDNDGITEMLYFYNSAGDTGAYGVWYAQTLSANTVGQPGSTKLGEVSVVGTKNAQGLTIGDYNNDGLLETLYHDNNGYWYARKYQGAGFSEVGLGLTTDTTLIIGDYNNSIPEPATLTLLGIGGLVWLRKRGH